MKKLLFKETINADIDKIYEDGRGDIIKAVSNLSKE